MKIPEKCNLWYLVGLITADGSLSKDQRHIVITSKDYSFLEHLNKTLKLSRIIGQKFRGKDNFRQTLSYYVQFSDVKFYRFLLDVGLFPNKSKRLNDLKIPTLYFSDFLRGIIDGDGNISNWVNNFNNHEQWSLRIATGSENFALWLNAKIKEIYNIEGKVYLATNKDVIILKFGKRSASVILNYCYYKDCLTLKRKYEKAMKCLES